MPATRQFRRGTAVKVLVVETTLAYDVATGRSATLCTFPASGVTTSQSFSPTHISMFPVTVSSLREMSLAILDIDNIPVQFTPSAPPFVVTLVFVSDLL